MCRSKCGSLLSLGKIRALEDREKIFGSCRFCGCRFVVEVRPRTELRRPSKFSEEKNDACHGDDQDEQGSRAGQIAAEGSVRRDGKVQRTDREGGDSARHGRFETDCSGRKNQIFAGRKENSDRWAVHGNEGVARRLLGSSGEDDGRSDRMGEARSIAARPGRRMRNRNSPVFRDRRPSGDGPRRRGEEGREENRRCIQGNGERGSRAAELRRAQGTRDAIHDDREVESGAGQENHRRQDEEREADRRNEEVQRAALEGWSFARPVWFAGDCEGHTDQIFAGWKEDGGRWAVYGVEGASRRLLDHRCEVARRSGRVGEACSSAAWPGPGIGNRSARVCRAGRLLAGGSCREVRGSCEDSAGKTFTDEERGAERKLRQDRAKPCVTNEWKRGYGNEISEHL